MFFIRRLVTNTDDTGSAHQVYQYGVVACILIIGVALSISAFFQVRAWEQSKIQNLFNISAHNRLAAFHSDIVSHREVVSSIAALFTASQNITREEYRDFVQTQLSTHPDIQALGWNPLIEYSERRLFEENTRQEGFKNFYITEVDSNNQQQRAAKRDDYIAVHYIEPYSGNEKAHGFDIASHPGRLAAIAEARDTGRPVITERIKLVQEKHDRFGYLLVKAVYRKGTNSTTVSERRNNFIGMAVGVLKFSESIPFTMRNIPPLGIDVWISDLSAPPDKQFLHFHASRTRDRTVLPTPEYLHKAESGLHLKTTIDVLGRKWSFLFTPAPAFLNAHPYWQSWATLAIGLLLIVFLSAYVFSKIGYVSRLATANRELYRQITEREQAEEALNKSEQAILAIIYTSKDWIWSVDLYGKHTFTNPAIEEILGYTQEEMIGSQYYDLIHEDDRKWVEEFLKESTETQQGWSNLIIKWRHKDGGYRCLESNAVPQFDTEGNLIGFRGVDRDITLREKQESKLRKLSQAVHHAGEAVIITDSKSIIEYVNPAFSEITGYTEKEVIGKTPAILKSSAQDKQIYDELWQTIKSGNVWHGTLVDKKKDGTFFPVLSSIAPICDQHDQVTHYVSLQQDMTEYKKLEEQFIQSQKMESIGVLVGGIAHDFNNMLAGILGNCYLAKSDAADNPLLLKRLEVINRLGERAANMIKQLLAFSRKDVLAKKVFSLTKFSKDAVKLAMTAIPENIEQRVDLTQDELFIYGDATQLQQVLMNLINNARDALEGIKEGQITFTLKEYTPDSDFRQYHPECNKDRYACLTLSDNGKGIPENIIDKVFDPFFTTKGVGKGTGLGLSMVYGAIENHNGVIELDSSSGNGATFNIYLPIVSDNVEESKNEIKNVVTGEKELILVVDDEVLLLVLTEELLQSFGYRVITAHNGEEAIDKFAQYKNEISLVILDVVMPVLGGVDAARKIRQMDHQVPLIFATGYDKDTALEDVSDIPDYHVLTKPYSAEKLSQVIKRSIK